MKHISSGILAVFLAGTVSASNMATPEEAKALSLNAQAAVNEMGAEKAFSTFADPNGGFRDSGAVQHVPEPSSLLMWSTLALVVVGGGRRRAKCTGHGTC